jgi:hypothetical protein
MRKVASSRSMKRAIRSLSTSTSGTAASNSVLKSWRSRATSPASATVARRTDACGRLGPWFVFLA